MWGLLVVEGWGGGCGSGSIGSDKLWWDSISGGADGVRGGCVSGGLVLVGILLEIVVMF